MVETIICGEIYRKIMIPGFLGWCSIRPSTGVLFGWFRWGLVHVPGPFTSPKGMDPKRRSSLLKAQKEEWLRPPGPQGPMFPEAVPLWFARNTKMESIQESQEIGPLGRADITDASSVPQGVRCSKKWKPNTAGEPLAQSPGKCSRGTRP